METFISCATGTTGFQSPAAIGQHYIDAVVTALQFNEPAGQYPSSLTAPVSPRCLREEQI